MPPLEKIKLVRSPSFDRNGHPTDRTLLGIEKWNYNDWPGLIEYLKEAWADYGKIEEHEGLIHFVTGGWSVNEELLSALHANTMIQAMYWESSHRGGLVKYRRPSGSGLDADIFVMLPAGSPPLNAIAPFEFPNQNREEVKLKR
jgi:hypothetical protein